jgi:hypothetical protein
MAGAVVLPEYRQIKSALTADVGAARPGEGDYVLQQFYELIHGKSCGIQDAFESSWDNLSVRGNGESQRLTGEIFFQADMTPFLAYNHKAISAEGPDHFSP